MNTFMRQIESAIRATRMRRQSSFCWMGRPVKTIPAAMAKHLDSIQCREVLVSRLHAHLYQYFYCTGRPSEPHEKIETNLYPGFTYELARHNHGQGYWDPGWRVEGHDGARPVIRKNGVRWIVDEPGSLLRPTSASGACIEARLPAQFPGVSPGFFMMVGDEPLSKDPDDQILRLYWNVSPHGVLELVSHLTVSLNDGRGIAYRLKALQDPQSYLNRCDTLVLYVQASTYGRIANVLTEAHGRAAADILPGVPAFTKKVAPGVGLAEDPGTGASFGSHRSRALAEGLVQAHEEGATTVQRRLEIVRGYLESLGLRPDAPYLCPGSLDKYQPLSRVAGSTPVLASAHMLAVPPEPTAPAAHRSEHVDALGLANQIAETVIRRAIWSGGACTWLGLSESAAVKQRSVGVDLHSGTSGIALFLSAHHSATGSAASRKTALAAMKQALGWIDQLLPSADLGFYQGRIGVGVAAVTLGVDLGVNGLVEAGLRVIESVVQRCRANVGCRNADLSSGVAGAVVGLLRVGRLLDQNLYLELAEDLGRQILKMFRMDAPDGWPWCVPGVLSPEPAVTGFAHGVSGVSYALAELGAVVDNCDFKVAARHGFEQELTSLSARSGERLYIPASRRGEVCRGGSRAKSSWCHGAGGTVLSWLRACQVWREPGSRQEAQVAQRMTSDAFQADLGALGSRDMSLCHGIAGRAEVMMRWPDPVAGGGEDCPDDIMGAVTDSARRDFLAFADVWPAGPEWVHEPGLMRGASGLGMCLLGWAFGCAPSILLPAQCCSCLSTGAGCRHSTDRCAPRATA